MFDEAEALSSARLANAVPGSSCPCNGPRSANSCSSNWSPGPRGKVPNTHCEGEKPPLRLRLFLVLTASAIAILCVVKTLDSVFGDRSFQHRLEQSSVSLNSSNLFRALHSCLTDQDSVLSKCTCKNSSIVDAAITTQGLWPTSPTDPQTDKAVQALSAGRRTVSLSQQHYLLKSSTQVENVQTQVRFVNNIFDFQNIDAEIPTENVVFWKCHFGRLMLSSQESHRKCRHA